MIRNCTHGFKMYYYKILLYYFGIYDNQLISVCEMNHPDEKRQKEVYREKVTSEWSRIDQEFNKLGYPINFVYESYIQSPGKGQEELIHILLDQVENKYSDAVKDRIYRIIACAKWLKGLPLTETIETLFRQFENNKMLFEHFETDEMMESRRKVKDYQGAKTRDEISSIEVRWTIGLALNTLISHRFVEHKKYQHKLRTCIKNKKYRKGRSELVLAYARLGKNDTIQDLIGLLDGWDLDVLGNTIVALGKLKAREAKPHLEKLLNHEDPYFRGLAKKALKKING